MNMSATSQEIVRVTFAGTELLFLAPDPEDHIQRVLRCEGRVYEEGLLLDCFSRKLPRGVVVDVGANIGNHTIVFAKAMGRKVIALEPYAKAFEVLRSNVELNGVEPLVTLVAAAAGRERGRADVQTAGTGNWGQTRVAAAADGAIEVVPLDELEISGRVALLKIDVEGMESDVLAGARRLIKRHRPLIYVETQNPSQYALVKRQLGRFGYRMLRRFNHTPTYLFACCRSHHEGIAALLDKTDALAWLEDLAVAQRDLVRAMAQGTPASKSRSGSTAAGAAGEPPGLAAADGASVAIDAAGEVLSQVRAAREAIDDQAASWRQEHALLGKESRDLTEALRQMMGEVPDCVAAAVAAAMKDWTQQRTGGRDRAARPRKRRSGRQRGVAIPAAIGSARLEVRVPPQRVAPESGSPGAVSRGMASSVEHQVGGSADHAAGASAASNSSVAAVRLDTTVSVIMTTFNSQAFVEGAARNVLAQTHGDLEVIIVDDASSDDTWAVLAKLAREDSRVRPVKMFKNRGTYWCKNYGLSVARGRYVTFQDSDDRSDVDRVRLQLQELRATGAVVCTCNYIRVDANGVCVRNRGLSERKAIMAVMFDRDEVLRHAGYFDSVRTSADDEFTRRLGIVFGQERICHLDQPLYLATVREGSLTNDQRTRAALDGDDASPSDQSFLSAPRREYVRQYAAWHERLKRQPESPYLPFPLLRRRFPAPSLILPEARQGDSFVTVSLASIPAREALLKQTVESILPQADVLNVYLNGYGATPAWLSGDKIQVCHSSEYGDLRDNGKFFFLDALLPGYHFTVDDDIVYPPDYVQKHILKIEQYDRRAVVGVHGVILADPLERFMEGRTVLHFKQAAERDRFVNILGTGTTAYHTDALKLSLADFPHPGMADVWLAIAAKRQGVPMVAVQRPNQWLVPLAEAEDTSLFAAARRDDVVQTLALKEEGAWDLRSLCESASVCQQLRARFTPAELASQDVDVDALAAEEATSACEPALTYA